MAATWLRTIARALGCDSSRVDLVSPLPCDECVRRLREVVVGTGTISGSRPLTGRVRETSFNLRKRIWNGNSFQTIARGVFEQESRQTRLRCRFGLDPYVMGVMILWGGAVSLIGGAGAVSAILQWSSGTAPWLMQLVGSLLMLAFTPALIRIGRFAARNEQSEILKVLTTTLDARETPVPDAG